jgi:two-component system LytT family sensor kinase
LAPAVDGFSKNGMKKMKNFWLAMPIREKVRFFVTALLFALAAAAAFNIYAMNYSTDATDRILTATSRCETAQRAMQQEEAAFKAYIHNQTEESGKTLHEAILHTENSIDLLPGDYRAVGAERYARTWNIRNAYSTYGEARDRLLGKNPEQSGSVSELYDLYDMQAYLDRYFSDLLKETVEAGSASYQAIYPKLHSFPYILILFSGMMFLAIVSLSDIFTRALVTPITVLAQAVRRIIRGGFDEPDVEVGNKDELGELVSAFNKMKHSAKANIETLKENQVLSEKLHQEELDRTVMEKRLETIRLNLLQSQINPHFLFNTLNTISGMAQIEEAGTTDQMIRALAGIFRYNLHTAEQFVSLTQELAVAGNYMYLQKMRFGDRLAYRADTGGVDTDQVMVPVFLLQPLIENAVNHGVLKKEQGGSVEVRVRLEGGNVHITVSDDGVGMSGETYRKLMAGLKKADSPAGIAAVPGEERPVGIGLGNIYQRIHQIYREGQVRITTKEGEGTRIEILLPQDEKVIREEDPA